MFKSGGNVQRENHMNKAGGIKPGMKPSGEGKPQGNTPADSPDGEGGEGGFSGNVHPDGKVTMKHSDGEEMEHPSMAHAMLHEHSKHEVGPMMHVHNHGGASMHEQEGMEGHHTVTTHHVGHEGAVEGPTHHGSMDEAAEHMKSAIGDGGGAMAHESAGAADGGGRPPLY